MSEFERIETGLGEECGVFGAYDMDGGDVASSVYYGLFALQHRGQESCGIAVTDTYGKRKVLQKKGLGPVSYTHLYSHYRDEMEAFAWNQLDRRNVDDRLRIIYKRFVVESSLNTERVKALYDICHAYLITTKLNNMKYVQAVSYTHLDVYKRQE